MQIRARGSLDQLPLERSAEGRSRFWIIGDAENRISKLSRLTRKLLTGGEFISNVFSEWNDKIEINFIENIVEVINTAKLDEKSKEYFFELFHLGYL